jgi:uncharacterized metal-binding protein
MKIFALGLMAAAVSAQATTSTTTQSEIETLNISVNKTAIDDLYEDYIEFRQKWKDTVGEEAHDVAIAIADAYKNAQAKMILNFGKIVTPTVRRWADLYKEVQVTEGCDVDCAAKCYDLDVMWFDQTCFDSCGC